MNESINGYTLVGKFTTAGSGSARWCFVRKNGKQYFMKEFLAPVYPSANSKLPQNILDKRIAECKLFEGKKMRLYGAIRLASNGNIIGAQDFFRHGSKYYLVTDRVPESSVSIDTAYKLGIEYKLILMKALTHCLIKLSNQGIVHADLKPSNIMMKRTVGNFYTLKLIDFDSSFFEDDQPVDSDDVQGDPVYLAPETYLKMCENDVRLTHKLDIFALGIIFHEILSGKLPKFDADSSYVYQAVLNNKELSLDILIDAKYKDLISRMLSRDADSRPDYNEIFAALTGKPVFTISENTVAKPAAKPRYPSATSMLRPAGDL